jgi:hypothetical protein
MSHELTVCRIMALGLGLPEETLVKQHDFDAKGYTSREWPHRISIDHTDLL